MIGISILALETTKLYPCHSEQQRSPPTKNPVTVGNLNIIKTQPGAGEGARYTQHSEFKPKRPFFLTLIVGFFTFWEGDIYFWAFAERINVHTLKLPGTILRPNVSEEDDHNNLHTHIPQRASESVAAETTWQAKVVNLGCCVCIIGSWARHVEPQVRGTPCERL